MLLGMVSKDLTAKLANINQMLMQGTYKEQYIVNVIVNFNTINFKILITTFYPVGNYMFKVNNRNTRARCEICSKLTIKTPERRHGAFIVNFEHISHLVLVFLLLTLSRYMVIGYYVKKVVLFLYAKTKSEKKNLSIERPNTEIRVELTGETLQ